MAGFYPYVVASLPVLHFGMKSPFPFEVFLRKCCGFIPAQDYRILAALHLGLWRAQKDGQPGAGALSDGQVRASALHLGLSDGQVRASALPGARRDSGIATAHPIINAWVSFDAALRNELVRIRARRTHIEPERYLRPDGYAGPAMTHIALAAHRNPSILEAEIFLDRQRWDFLDGQAFGHYFDFSFIVVYAYKLLILARWEHIRTADGQALLEKAIQ